MAMRSWPAFVVVVGLLFVMASQAVATAGTVDAPLLVGGLAIAAAGLVAMICNAHRAHAHPGRKSCE